MTLSTIIEKKKEEFDLIFVGNYGEFINTATPYNVNVFLEKAIRESVEETLLEVRYEDRKAVDWRDIGSPELIAKQSEAYGYNQALDKIEGKVKEFMK